ncbi:sensor histidine kinase [Pendulispora albinea]|uniref:histidine kinase n=1 Tax=Pendulispora albinea TaxID=2741071 RepID=A0ABZ2LXT8_9BACT
MRIPGKTERRLALAILVSAILPLLMAMLLANSLFKQAVAIWFKPEWGQQLDRGVDIYKDYVKAIRDDMKHQAAAIAADEVLREAATHRNTELIEAQLDALFPRFPSLVSLQVLDPDHKLLATRDRGRPVDDTAELSLKVPKPLSNDPAPPSLEAVFVIDRHRIDELAQAGEVVASYHQVEASRGEYYAGYLKAFAALLGITFLVTILLGTLLARGVTLRINRLAAAINLVAQGDLSVRVPVTGSDELTDLARTFNRMITEMGQSRARIEFLQRMGAWQEMAQRLAHEIKNPLTPIQLAVQECHRKYAGDDARFRALLNTTLEIVEEEVGTLRRLVGDFSNFARLPNVDLKESSLREFLRECSEQLTHLEETSFPGEGVDVELTANVDISWDLPQEPLVAAIDRQMLRRVVVNLVRNAVQAIRDAHYGPGDKPQVPEGTNIGHVHVSAIRGENGGVSIMIDDDGPGVPEASRTRVFDPYFTTKADGTGLGLAICKKVVVEHGGAIDVAESHLGGARFIVHLPPSAQQMTERARTARDLAISQGVSTASR